MLRRVLLVMLTIAMLVGFAACGKDAQEPGATVEVSTVPSASLDATVTPSSGVSTPTKQPTTPKPTATATIKPVVSATPTTKPNYAGGTLYQLADNGQMMSYILHTQNGKLVVLDGGYARNAADIIKLAKQLTGKAVPEIEAWFFSHPHSDHVDAFTELMTKNASALSVKHIYYNFPSGAFIRQYEEDAYTTYENFMKAVASFKGQKTIVQKGDKVTVDGILIETLITPDESITFNAVNEASVIYRMTIGGQRVLFLGDAYQKTGVRLRKAYWNKDETKNDLKADVVQMAHHGSQGVNKELYELIDPKVCLWPSPQFMWEEENQTNGSNPDLNLENIALLRYMRTELGIQKHYILKDAEGGFQKLVFPLDLG